MKKNIAMRLASGLMLSCLLSTCVISGTFAKYTTSDSATDSARVAKWGVTVEVTSDLFDASYDDNDVVSATGTDLVVAPGTSYNNGLTITLTGAPEVAVNVNFDMTITSDIKLIAGDYDDYTTGNPDDEFNLAEDYYPVQFTLTNGAGNILVNGNLAAIQTYFNSAAFNKDYSANTDLATINTDTDGTYNLSWAWNFETNNKADTYLGKEVPLQTINFEISVAVNQIGE